MINSYINYLISTGILDGVSPALHKEKLRELYIDDVSNIAWKLIESVCNSPGDPDNISVKCLVLQSFSGGLIKIKGT